MKKIDKAVSYAIEIAKNNYHGYSQSRRGKRDKDCSKVVLEAEDYAGYDIGNATYTGNMLKPLLAAGFVDVTKTVDLKTGIGLRKGDVLLRSATWFKGGHTALMINDTQIVQAQGDLDGVYGDSSGKEIFIRPYYNSPFKYVLRPPEEDPCLFVIQVLEDTFVRKSPGGSVDHTELGKNKKVLGISEVSGTWGRIQNQIDPPLWISINPDYPGIKRI